MLILLARRGVLPIADALAMEWGFVAEIYRREVETINAERRSG